jgi:predicted nucleic acid-binding protein
MKIFVDTSALYALVATQDQANAQAVILWEDLALSEQPLITSNYVLAECFALVQNRLGIEVVHHLQSDCVPVLQIIWIDEELHQAAIEQVVSLNHRNLSLVDCVSFEIMRRLGIRTSFTFDGHFHEQGFNSIP